MRPYGFSFQRFVFLVKRCVPFSVAVCSHLFVCGPGIRVKGKLIGGRIEHAEISHLIVKDY